MSRFGRDPRHSSGDLAYGDFNDRESNNPGQRWDPERFTRERDRAARARAPALVERDRYEEHDYYEPPREGRGSGGRGHRREISADGSYGGGFRRESGRGAPFHFEERDRFVFEERPKESFGPPARRRESGRYYDDDIDTFDGSPGPGPLMPFDRRRQSITKDFGPSPRRVPPRPGIIRRQSSLDTFDRKPFPRYGDRFREPPETIVVPSSAKRRSPPRYPEREFEDPRANFGHEEIRGYREREVSRVRRNRADSPAEFVEHDRWEIEEDEVVEKPYPRKGKTKMPAKLANKRAIIELGYPFEQEGETIIILKALAKEHIDEIIKISKEMNERGESWSYSYPEMSRTTYVIEGPPPPPPPEVIERRTEIIVSPPPPPPPDIPPSIRDWDDGHSTIKAGSVLANRLTAGDLFMEVIPFTAVTLFMAVTLLMAATLPMAVTLPMEAIAAAEATTVDMLITTLAPARRGPRLLLQRWKSYVPQADLGADRAPQSALKKFCWKSKSTHRDERSIKAEIRALEAEKKALKYEREIEKEERKAHRYKDRDTEVIIERERDRGDAVKIEKDRKGRMSLVR
ncbi:MAG: hypothetical protein Q9200_007295 [Gallowayella weberi]